MKEYLQKCCLLIFIDSFQKENPDSEIQQRLTGKLVAMLAAFPVTKYIYYSGEPADFDGFDSLYSTIYFPISDHPTVNYQHAFEKAFADGFRKVVMITPQTPQLEIKHLEEAFYALKIIEFAIGPATNGSYYLLGMNNFEPDILEINASTSHTKYKATIRAIGEMKAALYKLPIFTIVKTQNDFDVL